MAYRGSDDARDAPSAATAPLPATLGKEDTAASGADAVDSAFSSEDKEDCLQPLWTVLAAPVGAVCASLYRRSFSPLVLSCRDNP